MTVIDIRSRSDARRPDRRDPKPTAPTDRFGLDEVDPRTWKVVDQRRAGDDPFRTLALIRSTSGSFEVMQFGRGFEWTLFASLEAALAHVVVTAAALRRSRAEHDQGDASVIADARPTRRALRAVDD